MKLRTTILKYDSWHLGQISLQIMLLPILIFRIAFYFYNHTEIPISSKADEGKSQLRQQEEVSSEVKENQAQENRKLTASAEYSFLTASLAPLEHDPLSSVMCSAFRNVCGFHQNKKM